MPIKSLICKMCKASYYPETQIQKITKTCGVCNKELAKAQAEEEEEETDMGNGISLPTGEEK